MPAAYMTQQYKHKINQPFVSDKGVVDHRVSVGALEFQKRGQRQSLLKFMFSKKATKIDEIFTNDLTIRSNCQIDGKDFMNFSGFL